MRDILDVDRGDIVVPLNGDWFHMNAVYYDDSDNTLIVSGRNQGLVKVDMNNNLIWILQMHKNWGKAGADGTGPETSPFLLTAVDGGGTAYSQAIQDGDSAAASFDWNWGQHAPLVLPNGNILLFDNGQNRRYSPSDSYSRAVEYEINEQNMTVRQVWEYGSARGTDAFSRIISDVDYLSNTNNILFSPGIVGGPPYKSPTTYSKIIETTSPAGTVVFEATLDFKNIGPGGGFDMSYRAEKINLY
jgi:arylsulfate sulfotransferase